MPLRTIPQLITVFFKGIAMGAADVVPGVSGGTIAFISGIYEELIETIHRLDLGFFRMGREEGWRRAWTFYNLSFLLALFMGIFVSILSLAQLITYFLQEYPILVWSFFFGLVIASILYVGKQVSRWNAFVVVALLIAAVLAYMITLAEPIGSPDSTWFLFVAGFVAIIAMILPGISGAFILLLLGAYEMVIGALTLLSDGIVRMDWELFSGAVIKLLIFALGAILGLKVFSRALNWMFKHHKNLILAVLTGFMIGALNKIWPWKEVLEFRTSHSGEEVPFLERSILPSQYAEDPKLLLAIVFMVVGFVVILGMEGIANRKNTRI
jgi:putative membrane protein